MKIAVISTSAWHHAKEISKVCNQHIKGHTFDCIEYDDVFDTGYELMDMTKYDAILNIGYFIPIGIFLESVRQAEPDVKIFNVWIGSDILQNLGHYIAGMGQHVRAAKNYINLCDAPKFKEELWDFFRIKATAIKTTPSMLYDIEPLPDRPQMLAYGPHYRAPFYNMEMLMECASLCTDTLFAFLGFPQPPNVGLPNAKWFGILQGRSFRDVLMESTGVLRVPQHDGYSITSLQAMSMGRYVATNVKGMPHTRYVTNLVELFCAVREFRETREPNEAGSNWVRENMAPKHMAESIAIAIEKEEEK